MLTSGYIENGQVVFFDGVDKIYQKEFRGKEINSVTIPDTVVAIQSEAFAGCKNLTAITIPDSVKKISTHCFEGCTGLSKVVLPDGLKAIDEYVFKDCTSLEEVIIPDSVTKIAKGAFSGCSSLSKVVLSRKLKTICEEAFEKCKIESIVFPDSLAAIEKDAFMECPFTRLHIPSTVKSLSGFHGTPLEEVILDEGIETIGEECFCGCTSLVSLSIPESIKMIDRAAFMDCTTLRTLKLPKELDVLEDEAFRGCSQLKQIDIPEGVTKIHHLVFAGCTSTHVHLSSTVMEFNTVSDQERRYRIHPYKFQWGYNDMASLSVSLANPVLAMESNCLVNKQKRELLYISPDAAEFPKNLKSIYLSFGSLPPLLDVEELIIPKGVTHISNLPFGQMKKLKKLVLPETMQSLGRDFLRDYPFSSISVPPTLLLADDHFYYNWPQKVNLIGVESVSEELRSAIEKRFSNGWSWGGSGTCVYLGGQLVFPAIEVLRAREEAKARERLQQRKQEMAEKVEDMTLSSLCKAAFEPGGFAFDYLDSKNRLTVTIFDSLKMQYILQMNSARDDLAFLLDVATSYREALKTYISASSDPHLITRSEWKGYEGTEKYISGEPFPGMLIYLKLDQDSVLEAFQALDNLEVAYADMLRKYGEKAEKLVGPIKDY